MNPEPGSRYYYIMYTATLYILLYYLWILYAMLKHNIKSKLNSGFSFTHLPLFLFLLLFQIFCSPFFKLPDPETLAKNIWELPGDMISKLEQYAFICFYTNFITNPSRVERIWKRATECRISPFQTVNLPIFHLFIVHNWHFCLFYIFLRQLWRKSGWWLNNNFCRIKYKRWILKKGDGKFR